MGIVVGDGSLGHDFVWDGDGMLMHWSRPAGAAAVYLAACAYSNRARRGHSASATAIKSTPSAPAPAIVAVFAIIHNAALVCFSAFVWVRAGGHFAVELSRVGLRDILCPPPLPTKLPPPPLSGCLHFWCYVFYLSKYYEMVDTLVLIARRKRVILLHALHHAFIPLTMCILFEGRNAVSLIGLGCINSFVHVVMYGYYLSSDLGYAPSLAWKRNITRLQIAQFSTGVAGGTYYWTRYFDGLHVTQWWPRPGLEYTEGCAGGEPTTVLIGFLSNLGLLGMFVSFYVRTYYGGGRSRATKAA